MTSQHAIATLECMAVDMTGAWGEMSECNPMVDVIRQRLDAINMAQDALRAHQERENQNPLTLDELRQMEGEPVWIVPLCSDAGWTAQWRIYTVRETVTVKSKSYGWYFMYPKDYGKTWMAYRNKLEEDHK